MQRRIEGAPERRVSYEQEENRTQHTGVCEPDAREVEKKYSALGKNAAEAQRLFWEGERRAQDWAAEHAVEAVERYRPYIARQLAAGTHLAAMTRHMLGLFPGAPGARTWRRILTVESVKPGAGLEVVAAALAAVSGLQDQRLARRLEAGEAA